MILVELVDDIYMLNGLILLFIIFFGFFVVVFGLLYRIDYVWGLLVIFIGFGIIFIMMLFCLVIDDYGYYIYKEELLNDDKGVKV